MDSKVNFIGIGGQKCASTWVYDILHGHPEVSLSRDKEVDFFSNYWDRGYEWYASHFDVPESTEVSVIGEVSPSYLSDADAPERVAKYNRDMRIVVTVRDPVERAYSNHKHNIRQGFVLGDDLRFELAMENNPTYIEHGLYGECIARWLAHFPADQVLIVFFEDILRKPGEVAREIFRFLDIDENYQSPAIGRKSNASVAVANVRLAKTIDAMRNRVLASRFAWVWALLRLTGVRSIYRVFNMRDVEKAIPPMRPETRAWMRQRYKDDIAALESMTGRTLSKWVEQ